MLYPYLPGVQCSNKQLNPEGCHSHKVHNTKEGQGIISTCNVQTIKSGHPPKQDSNFEKVKSKWSC